MMDREQFQQLLNEQLKTNELLREANKDPSLPSSIKQNLGEILNASRLSSQSEKFQKKEKITETDDEVRKLGKSSKDIESTQGDMLTQLSMISKQMFLLTDISLEQLKNAVTGNRISEDRLEALTKNQPTASQLEEDAKKRQGLLEALTGEKTLGSLFKREKGEVKKLRDSMGFGKGSIISRLLKSFAILGGGFILADFLLGGDGMKLFEGIDKLVGKLRDYYTGTIKPYLDKTGISAKIDNLVEDIMSDKPIEQILADNKEVVAGAFILFFSRTLLAFTARLGVVGLGALFSKEALGGLLSGFLFGDGKGKKGPGGMGGMGMMRRGAGVLGRFGLLGVILTVFGGVVGAIMNAMKDKDDPSKITSEYGLSGALGFALEGLVTGTLGLLSFVTGLVFGDDAKKKLEETIKRMGLSPEGSGQEGGLLQDFVDSFDNFFNAFTPFITIYNAYAEAMRKSISQIPGVDIRNPEERIEKEIAEREKKKRLAEKVMAANEAVEKQKELIEKNRKNLKPAGLKTLEGQLEIKEKKLRNAMDDYRDYERYFLKKYPGYGVAHTLRALDAMESEVDSEGRPKLHGIGIMPGTLMYDFDTEEEKRKFIEAERKKADLLLEVMMQRFLANPSLAQLYGGSPMDTLSSTQFQNFDSQVNNITLLNQSIGNANAGGAAFSN